MRRYLLAALLLIFGQLPYAQKAKIFKPGKISLVGTHESMNAISKERREFYYTRADSIFSSSNVFVFYSRRQTSTTVIGYGIFSDSLDGSYYNAGYAFYPIQIMRGGPLSGIFTSKRPTNDEKSKDKWNLFSVEWDDIAPSRTIKPINDLNTNSSECCLVINGQGTTYFSSNRDGSWDIYQASFDGEAEKFTNIKKVDGLSTAEDEWPSYISPDGKLIIFSSIRKSGIGGDDLYFSIKKDDIWQQPEIFSEVVNTETYEDSGLISPDGKWFYFSSRRPDKHGNTDSNIYRIKVSKTKLKRFFQNKKSQK